MDFSALSGVVIGKVATAKKHPNADRWQKAYQARLDAARQSGRNIHLREQARFQLQVTGETDAALQTARANWETQRELSDLRLLLASAAAGDDDPAGNGFLMSEHRHGPAHMFVVDDEIHVVPGQHLVVGGGHESLAVADDADDHHV